MRLMCMVVGVNVVFHFVLYLFFIEKNAVYRFFCILLDSYDALWYAFVEKAKFDFIGPVRKTVIL